MRKYLRARRAIYLPAQANDALFLEIINDAAYCLMFVILHLRNQHRVDKTMLYCITEHIYFLSSDLYT